VSAGLEVARTALAGRRAWLVGGAVRDRMLGHRTADLDIVVAGDPAESARAIALAGRGPCFALSEAFGAWRVLARDRSWQIDVEPLRAGSLEEDLALRDFTVNAIAEPIAGGEPIDPLGGLADLRARRLRMAGPGAFAEDPLRVLRLVRVAVELGLEAEAETVRRAREMAACLGEVSPERVFVELRRILAAAQAVGGLELMDELGATAVVLPELVALRGVEQSRFHHLDVYGHTLEVLERTVELTALGGREGSEPRAPVEHLPAEHPPAEHPPAEHGPAEHPPAEHGPVEHPSAEHGPVEHPPAEHGPAEHPPAEHGPADRAPVGHPPVDMRRPDVAAFLAEPLADGMTRGEALRWGALLHDAAKPMTREVRPGDGRVTFIGHDVRGAELARTVLGRLRASERLRAHVAGLVRNHLRLGFLVHEPQPLSRRSVFAYLSACSPVEVDVTLLSIADRLATRGDRAREAIDAHLRLAASLLDDAMSWRATGPPAPLLRGDELASALGIPTGPRVGELLEDLARAQFAGELATQEDALKYARRLIETI
jgi:putative nucleotidyltransferase with HDIG domain